VSAGSITVELYDGRTFIYPATSAAVLDVLADLERNGVELADIRRTVHVIPRGTLELVHGRFRATEVPS